MNFLAEMGSKFRFSTVELDAIFKRNYMRRRTMYIVQCTYELLRRTLGLGSTHRVWRV